jgi:hypothetical protein
MTRESEKNVFSDARLSLNTIGKALDQLSEAGATLPAKHEQAINIAYAALRALDMSVRKIVGTAKFHAERHGGALATLYNERSEKRNRIKINDYIKSADSFFEGTERDTLKQEQAEAEERYYKNHRIDAACDADNAKSEEFCGPDGEGESK